METELSKLQRTTLTTQIIKTHPRSQDGSQQHQRIPTTAHAAPRTDSPLHHTHTRVASHTHGTHGNSDALVRPPTLPALRHSATQTHQLTHPRARPGGGPAPGRRRSPVAGSGVCVGRRCRGQRPRVEEAGAGARCEAPRFTCRTTFIHHAQRGPIDIRLCGGPIYTVGSMSTMVHSRCEQRC